MNKIKNATKQKKWNEQPINSCLTPVNHFDSYTKSIVDNVIYNNDQSEDYSVTVSDDCSDAAMAFWVKIFKTHFYHT